MCFDLLRRKKLFLVIVLPLLSVISLLCITQNDRAYASSSFDTTWKTNQSNPLDATVTIPTASGFLYNFRIDWGDGTSNSNVTSTIEHTYDQPGTYQISISGVFPRMAFKDANDRQKIQSVDSWGSIQWQSMVDAFSGCENLRIRATDKPDLSQVNSLSGMFRNARSMNDPIGHWDLGAVTGIVGMFEGATSFNQSLDAWDTSNVQMFVYTFRNATSFDSSINNWDMRSAISTNGMFADAVNFNKPLNNWRFEKVNDMSAMFHNAFSFNQDLSSWQVGSVTRMESMFRNAIQFEQDISTWNFSSLISANLIFSGSRLNSLHYDKLLFALSAAKLLEGVRLDAGTSTYCTADEARLKLINIKKWNITDGGKSIQGCGVADIRFSRGVGAVLKENEPAGTLIDRLVTVQSAHTPPFTYRFCEGRSEDSAPFRIEGDQLILAQSLDFETPEDSNQDNVYVLCIVSTSSQGIPLQKLLTVSILDIIEDQPPVNTNDVLGSTTTTTASNHTEVLSDNDSRLNAKVLAASGASILIGTIVGVAIISSPLFSFWKAPKRTQKQTAGFSRFKK